MPPVIAAVGTILSSTIGSAIVGAVISTAVSAIFAPSPNQRNLSASAVQSRRQSGAIVNGFSTIEPIPVLYGEVRTAPLITHMSTRGSDNKYLDIVVVWSEGEIEGVQEVYLDGKAISTFGAKATITHRNGSDTQTLISGMDTDVSGWAATSIGKGIAYSWLVLEWDEDLFPTGRPLIEGLVRGKKVYDPRSTLTVYSDNPVLCIRDYLTNARYGWGFATADMDDSGTFTSEANHCDEIIPLPQTAVQRSDELTTNGTFDTDTGWTKGAGWTIDVGDSNVASKAAGVADDLSQDISAVANTYYEVTFTISNYSAGNLTPDVGGTNGTARSANGTFTETIQCGATDSLIRFEADSTFAGDIDNVSVKGITEKRYTCNGLVDTDQEPSNNLRELETSCRGKTFFAGGIYKCVIERAGSSVFTIDNTKMVGGSTIVPPNRISKFNRVEALYFNEETQYKRDVYVNEQSGIRSSEDAGEVLLREIDLPFTVSPYTAFRISEQEYRQSRLSMVFECELTLEGFLIELMDIVSVTFDVPQWTSKLFRVIGMTLMPEDNVKVTLMEYGATVYADPTLTVYTPPPGTVLPDLTTVQPPTLVALASGNAELSFKQDGTVTSNIAVTWTASVDAFAQSYELEAKKSADAATEWKQFAVVSHRSTLKKARVLDVDDGVQYDVRIRTINTVGAASAWVTVTNHTVVGKTSVPNDVTNFIAAQNGITAVFQWDQVSDVDLAGYEIRYNPQGITIWADGTPLTKVTRGTNLTSAAVPNGSWTFMIKAFDTSGNESANAATHDLEFEALLDVIDAESHHPDWFDTKTGYIKHWTGWLVPDDQTGASGNNFDVFDNFVQNPVASADYETDEVDIDFDDTVRVFSQMVSALGPGQTGVANPEFQIDYRLAAGSYDGFEPWVTGNVRARYIKGCVHDEPVAGQVAILKEFRFVIDLQERTERASGVTIGASGTTITFARQFHNVPSISVVPVSGSALVATISAASTTQFTIHVYNTSGTEVGGTVDWTATGA